MERESCSDAELKELVSELSGLKVQDSRASHLSKEIIELLQNHQIRDPLISSKAGLILLQSHPNSLGDHIWEFYEKSFIWSLDAADGDSAKYCLDKLINKFSRNSSRVQRLIALQLESIGKPKEALEIYNSIIKKDPANFWVLKRISGVHLSLGDISSAIRSLNDYLKYFSQDESAWQQLSNIYTQAHQYELARYCQDELIMLAPENYLYHIQLAQTLYALKQYDLARNYFSQALELNENSLRAALGIIMCMRASRSGPLQLYQLALSTVLSLYRNTQGSQLTLSIIKDSFTLNDKQEADSNSNTKSNNNLSESSSAPIPTPSSSDKQTTSSSSDCSSPD